MSRTPSVKDLLTRGDELEVVDGRLKITTTNGAPVPTSWLKLHEDSLVHELVNHMAIDALIYES